ncbi:MAG: PIN domain-containing protein [Emticicia sp.]|nr:PIN domain-containing protein [Emticicia sp.]
MTNYIIDANVLFAAIISGKEHHVAFFNRNKLYTTDFAFIEIEKYRKKILKKAKLKNQQFFDFNVRLFSQISVIPALALSVESLELAYDLCEGIDTKDVMYIALTIEFKDATLITRDNVLHNKLREKGFEKIVLFQQVFDDFLAE